MHQSVPSMFSRPAKLAIWRGWDPQSDLETICWAGISFFTADSFRKSSLDSEPIGDLLSLWFVSYMAPGSGKALLGEYACLAPSSRVGYYGWWAVPSNVWKVHPVVQIESQGTSLSQNYERASQLAKHRPLSPRQLAQRRSFHFAHALGGRKSPIRKLVRWQDVGGWRWGGDRYQCFHSKPLSWCLLAGTFGSSACCGARLSIHAEVHGMCFDGPTATSSSMDSSSKNSLPAPHLGQSFRRLQNWSCYTFPFDHKCSARWRFYWQKFSSQQACISCKHLRKSGAAILAILLLQICGIQLLGSSWEDLRIIPLLVEWPWSKILFFQCNLRQMTRCGFSARARKPRQNLSR